jgi:F-type H+-transporting ATPase subunit b
MPQLDTSFYLSQIFWLSISFILLYLSFDRFIYQKINDIVSKRQEKISQDLKGAEEMKKSLRLLNENYKNKIVNARTKSEEIYENNQRLLKEVADDLALKLEMEVKELQLKTEMVISNTKQSYYKELNKVAVTHAASIIKLLTKRTIKPEALTKYLTDYES